MNMKTIDVSVVVPTKNEEVSVRQFIEWCEEGFQKAGVTGEIILMDSSTDGTREIASSMGAKIVDVTEPGLGVAYRLSKPHINGDIVIVGDADCTYDFRELGPFLEKISSGADLVMGSRFKGKIAKGAMPLHHQYFGSPATTFAFRSLLGIPVSDIHCGMRALTKEHFLELPFLENGWLYATEMIVASRNIGGTITEVPITFLQEPEGRVSHHVRAGWTSPFIAGWGTLRVVATYAIDRILILPSLIFAITFFLISTARVLFPTYFENLGIGNAGGALLSAFSIAATFSFCLGVLAAVLHDKTGQSLKFWTNLLPSKRLFTAGVWSSFTLICGTIAIVLWWISTKSQLGSQSTFDLTSEWLVVANFLISVSGLAFLSLILAFLSQSGEKITNSI